MMESVSGKVIMTWTSSKMKIKAILTCIYQVYCDIKLCNEHSSTSTEWNCMQADIDVDIYV